MAKTKDAAPDAGPQIDPDGFYDITLNTVVTYAGFRMSKGTVYSATKGRVVMELGEAVATAVPTSFDLPERDPRGLDQYVEPDKRPSRPIDVLEGYR